MPRPISYFIWLFSLCTISLSKPKREQFFMNRTIGNLGQLTERTIVLMKRNLTTFVNYRLNVLFRKSDPIDDWPKRLETPSVLETKESRAQKRPSSGSTFQSCVPSSYSSSSLSLFPFTSCYKPIVLFISLSCVNRGLLSRCRWLVVTDSIYCWDLNRRSLHLRYRRLFQSSLLSW